MKKFLLTFGLLLAPMAAVADSRGVEVGVADRCAPENLLTKENAEINSIPTYEEVTDVEQIKALIEVIAEYKFATMAGQIYPNVVVAKIGVVKNAAGKLVVAFADKDNCVWSYYVFTGNDVNTFFNALAKKGHDD